MLPIMLGTGLIAAITTLTVDDTFLAWAWRVPFLLSLVLVTFGLWVHSRVEESPMFMHLEQAHAKAKAPVREVVRQHWRRRWVAHWRRRCLRLIVAITLTCTCVTTVLQLPKFLALMALLIGTAFNALAVPLFACLSDRWGRRLVLAFGLAGQASFIIE